MFRLEGSLSLLSALLVVACDHFSLSCSRESLNTDDHCDRKVDYDVEANCADRDVANIYEILNLNNVEYVEHVNDEKNCRLPDDVVSRVFAAREGPRRDDDNHQAHGRTQYDHHLVGEDFGSKDDQVDHQESSNQEADWLDKNYPSFL